jgi:hypothetical protein
MWFHRYKLFFVITICIFTPQIIIAQWATNPSINNAVCTATNNQTYPTIEKVAIH